MKCGAKSESSICIHFFLPSFINKTKLFTSYIRHNTKPTSWHQLQLPVTSFHPSSVAVLEDSPASSSSCTSQVVTSRSLNPPMPTAAAYDEEVASESTPLTEILPSQSTDTVDADTGSEASEDNQVLMAEMNAPWPATFERGISLLASPVVTPRQANLVTKSPKPGSSFLFGRNAVSSYISIVL